MDQPPLDHNYVVMHLGGAKHVTRRGDGPPVSTIVDCGALTLVPAGASNVWRTEGPIAFAHLYIAPAHLQGVVERDFDCEGRDTPVIERVGCSDPLMQPLFAAMLGEVRCGNGASPLRLDCLFEQLCERLIRQHSSRQKVPGRQPLALAPHRLRRVLEFIEQNVGAKIALEVLAGAAGSSQSHFSRAFHLAMGCSPYYYVVCQRIGHAKVQLVATDASLEAISSGCGFHSRHQFSLMFKRIVGVGPKRYRMDHASPARPAGRTGR